MLRFAVDISDHVNGCRVVQAFIDCYGDQLDVMKLCVDGQHLKLATNQYGNYVVQCIIKRGEWYSNSQRIAVFRDRLIADVFTVRHLEALSVGKTGSHVIESCIRVANEEQLDTMIAAVQRKRARLLRIMMADGFGNYVVRTLLDHCSPAQQEAMVHVVHHHVVDLNAQWSAPRKQPHFGGDVVRRCKTIKRRMEGRGKGKRHRASGYGYGRR